MTRLAGVALLAALAAFAAGPTMQVRDASGKVRAIATGGDVVVVTFISTTCPVSNDYNDRLSAVYNDYANKGVKFYFVNANANEGAAAVAAHAKGVGFPFSIYKDVDAAEKLDAQATPETYVFDKAAKLVYHGYIDDARNTARVRHSGLREALDAVMAGKAVARPETKAFGCSIKPGRRS